MSEGPASLDTPRWTEDMLDALDPNEYDFQEFKGSLWLSRDKKVVGSFLAVLSKQISAFANGAGGRVFLGLDDEGRIDGGVPVDLKSGGTRSWLEDVIPGTVEPALRVFNVFEVVPRAGESHIHPGHAVYVIDVPASPDAPHQAHDHRYYLRIAGKSRPMGHIHVEDVLRRTRHPRVRIERIGPFGEPEQVDTDPRGPKVLLCFRAFIENHGRTLAQHVGAEVILPRPMVNSEVRLRMLDQPGLQLTQEPGTLTFFKYQPVPLFPGQKVELLRFWVSLHGNNYEQVERNDAMIRWRIYADDALPSEGQVPFARYKVVRRALAWLSTKGAVPAAQQARARTRRKKKRRKSGRAGTEDGA